MKKYQDFLISKKWSAQLQGSDFEVVFFSL
jgi:hypothetical protein